MQSSNLVVRPEASADAIGVRRVHELAFGQPDEATLVDDLRQDPSYVAELSIVGEVDGEIIAHILLTVGGLPGRRDWTPVLLLAPMAVLPKYQNMGIGSFLLERALAACKQSGRADFVVVVGHPNYYARFGFVAAETFGIMVPFSVPPQSVMVLRLGFIIPEPGVIMYPSPFGFLR